MEIISLKKRFHDNLSCMFFVENISFYYYPNTSKLIPWYDIFYYYFYIIENKIYINDFEFENVFAYFTDIIRKNDIINSGIFEHSNFESLNIENGIIIKPCYINSGHAFGNITRTIYNIFNNKDINLDIYNIIIPEDLQNYIFLQSIVYLFFKKEKIIFLKKKQKLNLKNTYIIRDYSHKESNSINFLLNKLKLQINNDFHNKHENIFLIKSSLTKNTTDGVFSVDYNNYFISKNFELVIPENYDIIQLFNIIYNAKNVILSWGCCSYLNSVFVNEKSNILLIANIKYNNEYLKIIETYPGGIYNSGWFPSQANKKIFLGDLPNELDDTTIELLNSKLFDLLS